MTLRRLLSGHTFENGFNATLFLAPENSDLSYFAPGSRNQLYLANVVRPWRGLDSQGSGTGSRVMFPVGSTWGGLQDTMLVHGAGSFFQDIGKSLWFIGAGTPSLEGSPVAAGVAASTTLKVSIAVNGTYSLETTYDAGLPQPSAPDIGIIAVPGVGYTGLITGPVAVKIARLRTTTGARSIASPSSAVVSPTNQTVRVTFPLPADGQDYWRVFFNQQGFGGVGLYYATPYQNSLDVPESLIGGTQQVETATVVGTITLSGDAEVVVTAAGMTGSPKTIPVAVLVADTASVVAGKMRTVLAADVDVSAFFDVSGAGAQVVLTAIDAAADDATMNIATDNDTCTGLTPEPTSVDTTAGVAPAEVDGIPRSLEFDYVDGDLVPEVAYIDDYPPPAGTHAVRLENVMCVLGAYGDSTSPVSTTDSGTVGAISLPNFYESYKPRFLVYFPESVVDVLSRPTDSYAFVGHPDSITAMQYVGILNGPAVQVNMICPDFGVPNPHNWCQFKGLLYVYAAKGALWRMTDSGAWDDKFASEIRELIQDWEPDDVIVGTHPDSMSIVLTHINESISWNVQNGKWSTSQYFVDAGVDGTALSCINANGKLYITIEDDMNVQTVYSWDEGATTMPVTSITNWTQHPMAASIEEIMVAFNIDNDDSPIIISSHRNTRKVYARDAATTDNDATLTSASYGFDSSLVGYMGCVFGEDVGGTGIDYLIFVIGSVTNSTTIEMADLNGDPLNAEATLSDCYLLIGLEIRTYDLTRSGAQQTPPMQNFYTTDALSSAIGISMITNADEGRVYNLLTMGTTSQMPASLTT